MTSPSLKGPAETVSTDLVDDAVWQLRARLRLSYRECSRRLAEGVWVRGELVQHQLSYNQISIRYKRLCAIELPPSERDEHVVEQLVSFQEVESTALGIMADSRQTASDRLMAGRLVDRVLRSRAQMLGLNAPTRVDVSVSTPVEVLKERAMQVLAERGVAVPENTQSEIIETTAIESGVEVTESSGYDSHEPNS